MVTSIDFTNKKDKDGMRIATMIFRLHAPWVHSLKEKRMIVKSLIAKLP